MIPRSIIQFLFLLFFYSFVLNGQSLTPSIDHSGSTKHIIKTLDSLYKSDDIQHKTLYVESEYIGTPATPSGKFKLFLQLRDSANRQELITIINDKTKPVPVRAYAYMAYVFQCDKYRAMSLRFNFSFKINALIGNTTKLLSFYDFIIAVNAKEFYNAQNYIQNPPTDEGK